MTKGMRNDLRKYVLKLPKKYVAKNNLKDSPNESLHEFMASGGSFTHLNIKEPDTCEEFSAAFFLQQHRGVVGEKVSAFSVG